MSSSLHISPALTMHHRPSISLCKLLSKYPLQTSSKIPDQWISNVVSLTKPKNYHCFQPRNSYRNSYLSTPTNITRSNISQSDVDTEEQVNEMNRKLAEAKKEIDTAFESKKTGFAAVKEFEDTFEELWDKLSNKKKEKLHRTMLVNIQQLKAELDQLKAQSTELTGQIDSPSVDVDKEADSPSIEADKEVEEIKLKLAEAIGEIDAARESKKAAVVALSEGLYMIKGLRDKLPGEERDGLDRAILVLKLEELKAKLNHFKSHLGKLTK